MSYQWTEEERAEILESQRQFNIDADAEMALQGYRPGLGLPFEGMPAGMFPPDPDRDDPRWADDTDDYYPGDAADGPDCAGEPEPGPGYPSGVAAGPGGPVGPEAVGRVIDALERVQCDIARLMGDRAILFEQARVLGATGTERARAGSRQLAERSLRAELAAALRIPERTIEKLLGVSRSLVHQFPTTLQALRDGEISYQHAQVMVDVAAGLPDGARAVLEGQALPHARKLTGSKFTQKARILLALLDPEAITERHTRAREDRDVRLDPQQDGMAILSQLLPAPDAVAIFNRLTDTAISLQGPTEIRTLAQLRADAFCDVMLGGAGGSGDGGSDGGHAADTGSTGSNTDTDAAGAVAAGSRRTARAGARRNRAARVALVRAGRTRAGRPGPRQNGNRLRLREQPGTPVSPVRPGMGSLRDRYFAIRPRLSVTVPALVLLGLSEEPGSLDGYGPIDPNTARQLAAGAPSMIRLLTHPETGAILSVGRDRYRVPADLRAFLQLRDQTCRFPGCSRQAELCDIDHTLQWQHQHPTAHYNLAHLCPKHHTVKDETAWAVEHTKDGTGTLEWTSPSGRKHITEPATTIQTGIHDNQQRALEAQDQNEEPPPF